MRIVDLPTARQNDVRRIQRQVADLSTANPRTTTDSQRVLVRQLLFELFNQGYLFTDVCDMIVEEFAITDGEVLRVLAATARGDFRKP